MKTRRFKSRINKEQGIALPMALIFVMVMTAMGALLSHVSIDASKQVVSIDATRDTFNVADGVSNSILADMSSAPELWRQMDPLASSPNGYTEYVPGSYISTNGIPSCSGAGCLREMYPVGGGLLKNYGPFGAEGDSVDTSYSILDQLDPSSPPTAEVSLNGQSGWSLVERLDEVRLSENSMGASLENNGVGQSNSSAVRFRVTGKSFRTVRGTRGEATVVYVVEVPAT